MMKKRITALLFAIFLMLSAFPVSMAYAENSGVKSYVKDGAEFPDFTPAEGINEVSYKILSGPSVTETKAANIIAIIMLIAGVSCLAAAVVFFVKDRKIKPVSIIGCVLAVGLVVSGIIVGPVKTTEVKREALNETVYGYAGEKDITEAFGISEQGYTQKISATKILSTFEYGYERKFGEKFSRTPHYWASDSVVYSDKSTGDAISNTENETGNYAYWTVKGGKGDYGDASYAMYIPQNDNYLDTRPFDALRIKYMGKSGSGKVNLTAIAEIRYVDEDDAYSWRRYELGKFSGDSDTLYEVYFPLSKIASDDRKTLARVVFRTDITGFGAGEEQHNRLYYADLCVKNGSNPTMNSSIVMSAVNGGGVMETESEYLGSLGYNLYGAYSASGFYDETDKKFKLWYGGGIPEGAASDNIYYVETTDIRLGWSKPKRLILNDPTGKLTPATASPGYGGDPCVIKVDGKYYMYFSGLENTSVPPNKIYLATSDDGIDFTVYGAVVDVKKGEGLGYGAGAPSVIYKDGKYYLYYYTQSATNYYTDENGNVTEQIEPTGCVLKVGDTPYSFGKAVETRNTFGAIDVKWVPSLEMWVACDYTDEKAHGGYDVKSVRIGFSANGTDFDFTNKPLDRPIQDYSAAITHNPGLIGTETGFGYETMFLTYGVNDLPFGGSTQMFTRQMAYSRITIIKA